MATFSGYFLTGLPANNNADQLKVYSCATSSGTFTLVDTLSYIYPSETTAYTVDDTLYYKVAFAYSVDGWASPQSDAIAGSQIQTSAPSVAITSSFDGATYSSTDDVYAVTNLTSTQIPVDDVKYALGIARSFIDLKTSNLGIERFAAFGDYVARKKYNAVLKILKDIEINYAASLVYRNMADDAIMQNIVDGKSSSQSISVGSTSIGGVESSDSTTMANYLDALSMRYSTYATSLLNSILPNYVPLRYSENGTGFINQWWSYMLNYKRL